MEAKPYLRTVSLKRDQITSFDAYPFSIPAVREFDTLEFHPDITFLVGENGSGKSTLIEAIALALGFGAEGGTKNVRIRTANDTSPLHQFLKLGRSFSKPTDFYFLRAESFYNVATYMEEVGYLAGYGDKSLHARSHGEAFIALLTDKLRGNGLYIFDEPEAALSPTRQLAALRLIHQLVQDGSQFIIATHSPILLSYPGAKILMLDGTGLSVVKYEDTEHFAVTKDFLNNYKSTLRHLLNDEP
jgi:predicted ATPase